jgi:hypothetical protein
VRLRVPSALRASAAGYLKRLDRLSDMALDPRVIAQEMKAAQDDVRQIEPFTSRLSRFDNAVAYEVSHLIHNARIKEGAVAVGRKIGFTNPDMWAPVRRARTHLGVYLRYDGSKSPRLARLVPPGKVH